MARSGNEQLPPVLTDTGRPATPINKILRPAEVIGAGCTAAIARIVARYISSSRASLAAEKPLVVFDG